MITKLKKRLKAFWEKEKFMIGVIIGMILMVMILVISLLIALAHLSIVGS